MSWLYRLNQEHLVFILSHMQMNFLLNLIVKIIAIVAQKYCDTPDF